MRDILWGNSSTARSIQWSSTSSHSTYCHQKNTNLETDTFSQSCSLPACVHLRIRKNHKCKYRHRLYTSIYSVIGFTYIKVIFYKNKISKIKFVCENKVEMFFCHDWQWKFFLGEGGGNLGGNFLPEIFFGCYLFSLIFQYPLKSLVVNVL